MNSGWWGFALLIRHLMCFLPSQLHSGSLPTTITSNWFLVDITIPYLNSSVASTLIIITLNKSSPGFKSTVDGRPSTGFSVNKSIRVMSRQKNQVDFSSPFWEWAKSSLNYLCNECSTNISRSSLWILFVENKSITQYVMLGTDTSIIGCFRVFGHCLCLTMSMSS